ncbi:MAG: hypothetical protein AAF958_17235 [Planctomycetota bacterium]
MNVSTTTDKPTDSLGNSAGNLLSREALMSRPLAMHWLVCLGLFLSLVWKKKFFQTASNWIEWVQIADPFFPAFFRSPDVARISFIGIAVLLLSMLAPFWLFVVPGETYRRYVRTAITATVLAFATILCVHQASYNDMTFTTIWWTALWATWLSSQSGRADQDKLVCDAAWLSRAILSMILLGGAVGKLTAEYWSGEALYYIYFTHRDFWVFNWLRTNLDPTTVRDIATYYSRVVVIVELVGGLILWRMPPKLAALFAIGTLASIALFSNFLLFSVLSCLIAMAASGFFVKKGVSAVEP